MKKIALGILLIVAIPKLTFAYELCGQDLNIKSVGNYSTGSGGPYAVDFTIVATNNKSYE